MKETKRDKFVRIVEARTNKIIYMIQLLGNCSNTALYEYDEKDVEKVFGVIQSELNEAKKRYSVNKSTRNKKFTFD